MHFNHLCRELVKLTSQHLNFLSGCHRHSMSQYHNTRNKSISQFQEYLLRYHARVGSDAKRVQSALCTRMRIVFYAIRLGPKTSECEKNVTVVSTVPGCDVTTVQQHYTGSTSTPPRVASLCQIREASLVALRKFSQIYACSHVSIVRLVQSITLVSRDFHSHSSPLYHLPGELVSLSSVPMPSIDLNLWNRSRPSAFVPMSLGFISVLTDDIVESFRNAKS